MFVSSSSGCGLPEQSPQPVFEQFSQSTGGGGKKLSVEFAGSSSKAGACGSSTSEYPKPSIQTSRRPESEA
jgi:hypothetical protein